MQGAFAHLCRCVCLVEGWRVDIKKQKIYICNKSEGGEVNRLDCGKPCFPQFNVLSSGGKLPPIEPLIYVKTLKRGKRHYYRKKHQFITEIG